MEEYRRRLARADAPDTVEMERKQIEVALKRAQLQQDRITDAYVNEAMELPVYKAKMDEFRAPKQQLEKTLTELGQRAEHQAAAKNALSRLKTFLETVARGLEHLTFEEKQELLRLVVGRIRVDDGKVHVDAIIPLNDESSGSVALRPPCFRVK